MATTPDDPGAAEGGWTPVDGAGEPDDVRPLPDLDLLADLTHPVRGAIGRRLREPKTVAELADALDVPITRLYHHVNRLEEVGIIRVVATRRVGAVTERRYQVTAKSWKLAEESLNSHEPQELSLALGSLFDVAKIGLQREVEAGTFDSGPPPDDQWALSLGELRLTPSRRSELMADVRALLEAYESDAAEDDPDAVVTTLFIAAYSAS